MNAFVVALLVALLVIACGAWAVWWWNHWRRPFALGGAGNLRRRGLGGGGFAVLVLVFAVAAGVAVSTAPAAGALAGW